MGVKYWCDHRD
ncbi:hypothetical protein CRE_30633 [Caenorhabditis remanei]|uniref:Uncharacterized protein n=1 Tax=Caenorhabditis remanei TaxID=31234 RepID=E3NVU2_CAERE|nr:hypothetical protein CRE_30633 [Caenorhabditis remanei]